MIKNFLSRCSRISLQTSVSHLSSRQNGSSPRRLFSPLVFALLLTHLAPAQQVSACPTAIPGDYNGDGQADVALAQVKRNGTTGSKYYRGRTRFLFLNSSQSGFSSTSSFDFKRPADALVPAFWDTCEKMVPGVVQALADGNLIWAIRRGGRTTTFTFGLNGDKPVAGNVELPAEDSVGLADSVLIRLETGKATATWLVKTSTGREFTFDFGPSTAVRLFLSDPDADGVMNPSALVKTSTGALDYLWLDRATDTTTTVSWGNSGDVVIAATDLSGDGGADYSAVKTVKVGTRTRFIHHLKRSEGDTVETDLYALGYRKNNALMSGSFFLNSSLQPVNTLAFYKQGEGRMILIRPTGERVSILLVPKSIGKKVFVLRPNDEPVSPDELSGKVSSSALVTQSAAAGKCAAVSSKGWLWKQSQDTGAPRQGKPMVLFSGQKPSGSCVDILASDKTTVVGKLGRFAADRFYAGWGCGEGYSGEEVSSKAQAATGSSQVFVSLGDNQCIGPIADPRGRTDRR